MTYITRELYEENEYCDTRESNSKWKSACEALQNHRKSVRPLLPDSMRKFSEVTLHDGVVRDVKLADGVVRMKVDCTDCPWGPVGIFELTFRGVKEASGLDEIVGDLWLYEEVDLHPAAGFEYRVLFQDSETSIAADEVEFKPHPNNQRSHIVKRWAGVRRKRWERYYFERVEGRGDSVAWDFVVWQSYGGDA